MSLNCTPKFSHCLSPFCLFIGLFVGIGGLVNPGFAQPVHPYIQLSQPTDLSTNALGKLQQAEQPAIGLYLSRKATGLDPEHKARLEDTIQEWEYFLVGLQLPYVLISDSLFSEKVNSSLEVLIVPAPESLQDSSLQLIQQYVDQGGGLLLSGYSNRIPKKSESKKYVKELAGIEELLPMGIRTGKVRQKLTGQHVVGRNLPLGFELDLFSSETAFVAKVGKGEAVGHSVVSGEIQPYTCIATNTYGDGRVVWMGFSPQDVPPNEVQQRRYQELVIDAMVYAIEGAYASVRRWPSGYQSAVSFAQLPSSGYQPFSYRTSTDLLLNAFNTYDTDATFFIVLQHAQDHPDLLARMINRGEFGLVSDSPQPLSGLTEELQYERLAVSKWYLEAEYGGAMNGALPPGYLYDANTLRVFSKLGIRYLLSDARHFQEPTYLAWEEELDYRDSLIATIQVDSVFTYQAPKSVSPLIRLYPTLFSYDLDNPITSEERRTLGDVPFQSLWGHRLNTGFGDIHGAGGLFVFGFEPETMGLTEQRAQILESFIGSLREENTWSASLSQIVDWWVKRDSLYISLVEATPGSTALVVENKSEKTLSGVSVDLFLPDMSLANAELESDGIEVKQSPGEENLHMIQIEQLPKGRYTIRWIAGAEAASGESEP